MGANLKTGFVIDVEATCWPTPEEQGNKPNEIIEIGVAELEYKTGLVVQRASIVVKPRFSEISEYCAQLTGWTQQDIDAFGVDIVDAFEKFRSQFKPKKSQLWFSCGEYDRYKLSSTTPSGVGYRGLYRDMGIDESANCFDNMKHINIKTLFALKHGMSKEMGMARMIEKIGAQLEGKHHNGADDAFNIAKIVRHVFK